MPAPSDPRRTDPATPDTEAYAVSQRSDRAASDGEFAESQRSDDAAPDDAGSESDTDASDGRNSGGSSSDAASSDDVGYASGARGDDDEPVLPRQTRDDDPREWGEYPDGSDDERILREVPPHH